MLYDVAVVNKLIKEIVPNIRVSTDARDLLLNCCTGKSSWNLSCEICNSCVCV